MSRYGERYVQVRLEDHVAQVDWEMLDRWFGMYMVVAPEVEEAGRLDDYLTAFGWRLAGHFKPLLNERMEHSVATDEEQDELSDDSLHYRHLLTRRLAVRWLALD